MAFCYLRVVGRGFARVILPELILDRSATAEDLLIALKAICPDVKDWDSAIGGLYRH